MKFSIIIPAHNSAGYIRKALDSIKSQTFTDYELIVICDSCVDDTEQIAKQYAHKVERCHYGQDGQTRNLGIDIAEGEWILFMDDDDWWMDSFVLENINRQLTDDIDILCFGFLWSSGSIGKPQGNRGHHWIAVWNKCWRRSFIGSTRFSAKYMESDVDFHIAMFNKQPRTRNMNAVLYYYNYMRKGSQTELEYRKRNEGLCRKIL